MAACPICASPLGEVSFSAPDRLQATPGLFGIAVCPGCGAGRTLPEATSEELAAFYPSGYGPYEGRDSRIVTAVSSLIREWQGIRAQQRAPLSALADVPPGRGLDVGAGRGDLAASLARRGWDMAAIEPSRSAAAIARRRGVDAQAGTLRTVPLEPESYDAVIFHHSLEHVEDPVFDLRTIRDALRPGGLLLVVVPNFGSWQARVFRGHWYPLDLPRHRTHFTRASLARALEESGFAVEDLRTSSSEIGLVASLQYVLAGRCLFPSGLRLRVASGLARAAYPLAALLDRLAGDGDVLRVLARRV
jgi:SAM-dependent methyltransferase